MAQTQSRTFSNKDLNKPHAKTGTTNVYNNASLDDDFIPDSNDDFQASNVIEDDFVPDNNSEPNATTVNSNEPGTWMSGFLNSFRPGGEVEDATNKSLMGYLKGATIDIPSTIWNGVKSVGQGIMDEFSDPMGNGLNVNTPATSIDLDEVARNPESFGRTMGQMTGQPLVTAGMAKGAPSAVRGAGNVAESTGKFIAKHTPLSTATGAVVGASMGGFPGAILGTMKPSTAALRIMERPLGRGIESIGKKMQNFGKKPLQGELVSEEMPNIQDGEYTEPIKSMKVIRKELPPSNTSFYGNERNPNPSIITPDRGNRLQLPESKVFNYGEQGLVEGQELPISKPKLKMLRNQNGTFTNLDTGEIVNSKGESIIEINGKPVSKQILQDMKNSNLFLKNRQ